MIDLSSKAMTVALHISRWDGAKTDRLLSRATARSQDAELDSVRVIKNLIPDHYRQPLRRCAALTSNEHRNLTMPGFVDGQRLLTTLMYDRYTTIISGMTDTYRMMARDFAEAYPSILKAAPQRMGKSFKISDYPHPESITDLFSMRMQFMPIPSVRDWRMDHVDQDMVDGLKKQAVSDIETVYQNAHRDILERLKDILTRVAEQAKSYSPVGGSQLRDALFADLKEIGTVIPMMNLTNDPKVEQICEQIRENLATLDPKEVRSNDKLRQKIATLSTKLIKGMK